MPAAPRNLRHAASAAALLALGLASAPSPLAAAPARLLAHWTFDEAAPPYASHGPCAAALAQDASTTSADALPGVVGNSTLVGWAAPGPATRLHAAAPQLQRDSFGFSFWFNPTYLEPFNTILGKETAAAPALRPWEKMAWQVQVGADDGTGAAPLEFIVRGSGAGFHGRVLSTAKLALARDTDRWHHVAGGYDAATGELRLCVDGLDVRSADPAHAGAINSDGGALVLGTRKNGPDVVGHGAGAAIDELQIYDAPLGADEVAFLRANPARAASARPAPALRARWRFDEFSAPYAGSAPQTASLVHDPATLLPGGEPSPLAGGRGVVLRADGAAPTRLHTAAPAVQLDSFGFAFWLRADALAPYDALLTKEIPAYAVDPGYSRLAWRLQIAGDADGDGYAPLELVVRGAARSGRPAPSPDAEPLRASIVSARKLPLGSASGWIHVAGGYDHVSGAISLHVDGVSAEALGAPGAASSDGSPLSVGASRNGSSWTDGSAARAAIDDLQLYDGPLARADVALLANHPGLSLPELSAQPVRDLRADPLSGATALSFDSEDLVAYAVQASVDFAGWRPVASVLGSGSSTSVSISRSALDEAFGPAPRARVFFRLAQP